MRNILICAVCCALLAGGCATSVVTHIKADPDAKSSGGAKAVAHMQGLNSGVFLFYWIPLWSGKENRPNRREYKTFQNRVEKKHMRKMLDIHAKRLGGDSVDDVKIHTEASGFWSLWILWTRSVYGTATAVKTKK